MIEKLKLNEECDHPFVVQSYSGRLGCPDCGLGDTEIKMKIKGKPRKRNPIVDKINEIIDFIQEKKEVTDHEFKSAYLTELCKMCGENVSKHEFTPTNPMDKKEGGMCSFCKDYCECDKKEEVEIKVNKDCLLGKCCHILGNCNFDKKEEQDFCEQGNLNCFKKTCKHLNPSPVTECKHEDGLVATETINTGDFITIEGNHARKWKKDDPISKMQVELFTN